MDDDELLDRLERLATSLGDEIRYEAAGGRSGKCVLQGRKVMIVDSTQNLRGKVDALAIMLAAEDLESIYLPPALRLLLDTYAPPPEKGREGGGTGGGRGEKWVTQRDAGRDGWPARER